ncbi:MAG: LPS assembly lipoprotein LptE [Oleiphilaceae bacterium]|nr:LPS assembly lipoprotein LptE [Oleiphilaceae bacterium]
MASAHSFTTRLTGADMHRAATLCLLLCLLLSGCGFQLRGMQSVPQALKPLSLECRSGVDQTLCRSLRQQLESSGLLAAEDSAGNFRLVLSDYSQSRRVSAITGRAAAAEYQLTASVNLSLFTPEALPLLAETTLQATQAYRSDETQVLAEEGERGGVQSQLSDQLALQVMARLRPFDQARIDAIRAANGDDSNSDDDPEPP